MASFTLANLDDLTSGSEWLNLQDYPFNAVGNGIADDTAAVNAWIAAVVSSGTPGYAPTGRYKITSQMFWDMTSRPTGIKIFGDGSGATIFDVTAVASTPQFLIGGSAGNYFNCSFGDFGVDGSSSGITFQIGHSDFSDPINSSLFYNINVKNAVSTGSPVACTLGYLVTNTFINLETNNGGSVGTSLQMLQSVNNTFVSGSYSTGAIGVNMLTGYNYGNTFTATDIENTVTCLQVDTAKAHSNTFIGGQFVWSGSSPVVLNTAGNYFWFIGVNPSSGSTGLITGSSAGAGLWLERFVGAVPAGGILVQPASGTDASVAIAAASGQSAEVLLQEQSSGAQKQRWGILKNNASESGGNAGSDLLITRYNDAGVSIDNPLSITRSTGIVQMLDGVAICGGGTGSWSLFGSSPVTAPINTTGAGSNPQTAGSAGASLYDTTWDGGVGSKAYTVFDLVKALKLSGLLAS